MDTTDKLIEQQESQNSCTILPMDSSNFYHDREKYLNGDSSYTEEQAISIQEDNEEEEVKEQKKSLRESDPEMENARLLQKHAQLQGVNPADMYFGKDPADERIVTADHYIDDEEEEAAERLHKSQLNDQGSESEIEQIL